MSLIVFDEFPYQSVDGSEFHVYYGYEGNDETPFKWSVKVDQAEKEYYMSGGFQDMIRYIDRDGEEVEKVEDLDFWIFKSEYPTEWRAFMLRLCKKHFSFHNTEVKPQESETKKTYKSLQPAVKELTLPTYQHDSLKTSRVKRQA